ncbi:TPA: hypothetical protein U2D04_001718 [Streptococcus suis]|nr:hypothetical protein [Streptococcus suis]
MQEYIDNILKKGSSLYEQEKTDVVAKLTNLKILDNREYLKSCSVDQRVQNSLLLIFYLFISLVFSWVGGLLPDTISNSLPMKILVIVLGLIWLFVVFYYLCDLLLSLTGFRARFIVVFLSWFMNAYLVTYILFNSIFLSSSNIPTLERFFSNFSLDNNIKDFWYITGITAFSLLVSVFTSLHKKNIFDLEKLEKYSTFISTVLALVTYIINISISDVNFAGQFLFFLLIEMLTSSSIISYKMKKMQEEAEKIFRKEVLRIHPVYANLKRCYVVGGETYKDKMLSNEKFLKVILWNEENSFYTWKTYENYSEYKNYRFKQFQKK